MQVPELLLALYDAFSPAERTEKERVRSEIMGEWKTISTDKTSELYRTQQEGDFTMRVKSWVKSHFNGGYTSLFVGLSWPPLFKWFTQLINPTDDDKDEVTGVVSLRP